MPFIHIKSLPQASNADYQTVMRQLSGRFAKDLDMQENNVTVTWEVLEPERYLNDGRFVSAQPQDSHPVMVDLLVPDFNSEPRIEKMMECIVELLSVKLGIPVGNVFVNCRPSSSGMVLDKGEVMKWRGSPK
jgi:phenylpyruvate tautomerase PptA (4-oxalocrotonate tautomerase family)